MHLTLDIGNTQIKAHLFRDGQCIDQYKSNGIEEIKKAIAPYRNQLSAIIFSDVSGLFDQARVAEVFGTLPCYGVKSLQWPFNSQYTTPQTLGDDRIALVAAAVRLQTDKAVVVIDAGTCLTIDLLTADHTYIGGTISPGLAMRCKGLQHYTGSLPLVTVDTPVSNIGNNTSTALQAGVFWGMVHEIDGHIDRFKKDFPALTVILTGGDAHRLSKSVKNSIFVAPNFLAEGLDFLLTFNTQRI